MEEQKKAKPKYKKGDVIVLDLDSETKLMFKIVKVHKEDREYEVRSLFKDIGRFFKIDAVDDSSWRKPTNAEKVLYL